MKQLSNVTRYAVMFAAAAAVSFGPSMASLFGTSGGEVGAAFAQTTRPAMSQEGTDVTTMPAPTTQITLNFKDASVDAVLDYLSNTAGFIVTKEGQVSGRVTLLSRQPVSAEEAVSLLNTVLRPNGYTAIQMGRVLKITALDRAKRANIPVHFGNDPMKIAQTDELITQVIPVRSVDAVKLKADLQPLIDTGSADWSANGGSNTLILTDTSANVRRIVQIVSNLDKRDALENTIKVKQLEYADATAAATLITTLFQTEQQTGAQGGRGNQGNNPFFRRGGGFPNFGGGGNPFGGAANGQQVQGGSEAGQTGRILAAADARTNTVVVTGPADTLKIIEEMLNQLDSNPAAESTFFMYPLKNGQSDNLATVLNNLFQVSGTRTGTNTNRNTNQRSTNSGRTIGGGGNLGNRGNRGGGATGRNTGTGSVNRGGFNQGGTTFGGFGGFGGGGFGQLSRQNQGLASNLAGQVYVVSDPDTNSLLVSTASKYADDVRKIISDLDRPIPQVLIKVLIAEVTHNNSNDLGTDFSIVNLSAAGRGVTAGSNFGRPANGLSVGVVGNDLNATLHALATSGKVEVLSRPYILTSDNQVAEVNVGQTVPIITDTRLDINNNPINQFQYENIGITLSVTPHINPDGLVIMDVSPSVSSFSDQTVAITSTTNAQVFNNRSADTRVAIKNSETIVIGGLMEDRSTQSVQKIPLLGDIPLVGLLFSRQQTTKAKTELLFFLTPHVALSPDQLQKMSNDEALGLKLVPGAIQPGTYQEHLKGLQRGSTTGGNQPIPIPETDRTQQTEPAIPEPKLPGTGNEPVPETNAPPSQTPPAGMP